MADARQLSGLDAAFLYLDQPQAPMHVGAMAIYDPASAPGAFVRAEDVRDHVAARLDVSPVLRQRLQRVPMGLDHPYWVDDAAFDLDDHVTQVHLPAPGGWDDLCRLAARLFARPMDMANPVWELTIVDGLDAIPGAPAHAFALIWKFHHSAVDGLAMEDLIAALHSAEPCTPPVSPMPWHAQVPPDTQALFDAAQNHAQALPMASLDFIRRVAPQIGEAVKAVGPDALRAGLQAPRTALQGPVSGKRVIDARTFSLPMAEEIRRAVQGATLNDVFLTVIGGALRLYLQARDDLPAASMRSAVPVSLRRPVDRGRAGNLMSVMLADLGSTIEDPLQRLRTVRVSTLQGKGLLTALGPRETAEIPDLIPPPAMAMAARAAGEFRATDRLSGAINTIVSNIPGSRHSLYCAGARASVTFALMPVPDGLGLVHGVHSYGEAITITITACRDRVPDPDAYADCLTQAFEALRSAALDPEHADPEHADPGWRDPGRAYGQEQSFGEPKFAAPAFGRIDEDWRDWKMADYPLGADIETLLNRMQAGMDTLKDALRRTGTSLDQNQRKMANLVLAQADENLRATFEALRSTMRAKDAPAAIKAQGEAARAAFERSLNQVRELSQFVEATQENTLNQGNAMFSPALRSASDFFAQLRSGTSRIVPDDISNQIERYLDSMRDSLGEMREALRDVRGNLDASQQQVMSLVLAHSRENLDKTYEALNRIVGSKDATEAAKVQAQAVQDAIERGVSQVRQMQALVTDGGQAAFEPVRDFYAQLGSASDFFSRLGSQANAFNFPSMGSGQNPMANFGAMGQGDAEKVMSAMQANMSELQAALRRTGESMTESQREIAELLMAHARENMEESMRALQNVAKSGDVSDSLRLQGNALKDSLERNMRQIREITELVSSGSQDAMKPLSMFFEQLRQASEALANIRPGDKRD